MKWIQGVVPGLMFTIAVCLTNEVGAANSSDPEKPPEGAPKSTDTMAEQARQNSAAFAAKAQKAIDELKTKIATVKGKAQKIRGEARVKLDEQIKNLERDQKAAQRKLAKLRTVAGEEWQTLKTDVSTSIDHLRQSVEKAKKSLK
jgi:hypothetical protein